MTLLKFGSKLSAETTYANAKVCITGMKDNEAFASVKTEITKLETLNEVLGKAILPRKERNHEANVAMTNAKNDVLKQLEAMRQPLNDLCKGDVNLERMTGYPMSKDTRTTRTSIAAAVLSSAKPTGIRGQLEITLKEAVPGNTGFEVHYVLEGRDVIAGVAKIQDRTRTIVMDGFPSLKPIEVHLITLSTHNLRSLQSNGVPTAAI